MGEKLQNHAESDTPQTTEWDKLTDGKLEDIELTESPSAEMALPSIKLPQKIENARRSLARMMGKNTMPNVESLAEDATHNGLNYIDDLCENWPLFKETQKIKFDGVEIDFPRFYPEVKYVGGLDLTGYLSTTENPELAYKGIKGEIGKKTASIYAEACLDNPLVSTINFEVYPKQNNSDYTCYSTQSDDLKKARIRLIDESVPLDTTIQLLDSRMAGVEYLTRIKNPEMAESIDTVQRATTAYHEIGHSMDFLVNHLGLHQKQEVSNVEISEAMSKFDKERAREIECSKSIPDYALREDAGISMDELYVILSRRGFDFQYTYSQEHFSNYNRRRYREMPCEAVADEYARQAICVRHRDHYFAHNEIERRNNPDKKNLPIYGEIIYLGEASEENDCAFLDQELMNCGIIAGQRLVLREEVLPKGITVDPQTRKITLPDDYDYHADQKRQATQPILVEGIVKQNPSHGKFELVDEDGDVRVIFGGQYRRQQNEMGQIEFINGDLTSGEPVYRIQFDYSPQAELAKKEAYQCGPAAFNIELGIDTSKPNSILFVNDNGAARVYLPEGGFVSRDKMIDETGVEYDIPRELFVYNGIPKVKLFGEFYEVVSGSVDDLEALEQRIIEVSKGK